MLCLMLIAVLAVPALAAAAGPEQTAPVLADAAKVRPQKAVWVGQTAIFELAKIYEKVTYLFVYQDPLKPISGVEQKMLARKLAGQSFRIDGLYQVKNGKTSEYFWRLSGITGNRVIWIKDYEHAMLSDMPFALPAEIEQDGKERERLKTLPGQSVWYNSNSGAIGDKVHHLEELTLKELISDGPFSDTYTAVLLRDNGDTVEWKTGVTAKLPVYSNAQFYQVLQEVFLWQDPYAAHKAWKTQDWELIQKRTVKQGWEAEKVLLSWGKPDTVYRGEISALGFTERWLYKDRINLFFKNGVLAKILIPKPAPVKLPGDPAKAKDAGKAETQNAPAKKNQAPFANYKEVDQVEKVPPAIADNKRPPE